MATNRIRATVADLNALSATYGELLVSETGAILLGQGYDSAGNPKPHVRISDVHVEAALADLPATGLDEKIYVADNKIYKWDSVNAAYVEIAGGTGSGGTYPEYATKADLPTTATDNDIAFVQDEDKFYAYDGVAGVWDPTDHTFVELDARYYTQTDINNKLAAKSDTTHTHFVEDLSDVDITNKADGKIIKYDGVAGSHVYVDPPKGANVEQSAAFTLSQGQEYVFTHGNVLSNKAVVQILEKIGSAGVVDGSYNFTTASEYTLEDGTKSEITNGLFKLTGQSSYTNAAALTFDGVDDYINLGNTATLNPGYVSLEAWIYIPALPGVQQRIIDKWYWGDPGERGYILYLDKNGHVAFNVKDGNALCVSTNPVPTGKWFHVAGTFDGLEKNLYIDGVLDISNPVSTAAIVDGTNNAVIGSKQGSGEFFEGILDDVRIWDHARTSAEIGNNYNQPLSGSETGLMGYYQLDEGTGTVAGDKTANLNDGTINGAAAWEATNVAPISSSSFPTAGFYSYKNAGIDLSNVSTINSVSITHTVPVGTNVKVLTSFDDGTSWNYYDTVNKVWTSVTGVDFTNGNAPADVEGALMGYAVSTETGLNFAFELGSDGSDTPSVDSVSVNVDEVVTYEPTIIGKYGSSAAEVGVKRVNETETRVKRLETNSGTYVINLLK